LTGLARLLAQIMKHGVIKYGVQPRNTHWGKPAKTTCACKHLGVLHHMFNRGPKLQICWRNPCLATPEERRSRACILQASCKHRLQTCWPRPEVRSVGSHHDTSGLDPIEWTSGTCKDPPLFVGLWRSWAPQLANLQTYIATSLESSSGKVKPTKMLSKASPLHLEDHKWGEGGERQV
jgi:hypothetical protein